MRELSQTKKFVSNPICQGRRTDEAKLLSVTSEVCQYGSKKSMVRQRGRAMHSCLAMNELSATAHVFVGVSSKPGANLTRHSSGLAVEVVDFGGHRAAAA